MAKTPEQVLRDAAGAVARGQFTMARRFVDTALDAAPPLALRAEFLSMRGLIRSEQGDHRGAQDDLEQAVQGYEAAGEGQSTRLAKTLGLLAQEYAEHLHDPVAARPLYARKLAILDAQLDTVLRDAGLRLSWIMGTLGLALISEVEEDFAQARRFYEEARAKCDRARLLRTHRLRGLIAEGLARLP